MTDHPRVRAADNCPLCGGAKNAGLVACWPCYRSRDLRGGNAVAERLIDQAERALSLFGGFAEHAGEGEV